MKNTLAVITGASSGIGKAYALFLAAGGYDLLLVARREDILEQLKGDIKEKFGVETSFLTADLSNREGVNLLLGEIKNRNVSVLVHAAGFGTRGHLVDLPSDVLEKQIYLHSIAGTLLARAVLPGMKKQNHGIIVFISSLAAFLTTAEYPVYSATKSYLNTLAIGLRDELAGTEVKVQAVCPGLTRTGFMHTEYYKEFDYSAVPEMFWMDPEEVVDISWRRLTHRYKPVIIPGRMNRMFLNMLQFPILGNLLRALMGRASRRRVAKGLPPAF
jgi:short-subunit dehydrogenase